MVAISDKGINNINPNRKTLLAKDVTLLKNLEGTTKKGVRKR